VHNKVFGELAGMTLAGWDEKSCLAAVADPQTSQEVLKYFIAAENLRPTLVPALIENPSVAESELVKLALSALRETIEVMLKSARVRSLSVVLEALKANPYVKKEELEDIKRLTSTTPTNIAATEDASTVSESQPSLDSAPANPEPAEPHSIDQVSGVEHDEEVSNYFKEHAQEIDAEGHKPYQAIGGVVELLGSDYFPVTQQAEAPAAAEKSATAPVMAKTGVAAAPQKKPHPPGGPKRENTLQKINNLDVKGRIQLALKGNKEERSLLIRDGTKVVALSVLDAPKLSDGEVEQFASQKNVLEAVLRQIPLKRRFMKNYIVVRNLVFNPRTPLDLSLGLMKNLLIQDLKNLSANKEVSETIRKLGLKMYKQKVQAANKK
jgi:hypothetical protein